MTSVSPLSLAAPVSVPQRPELKSQAAAPAAFTEVLAQIDRSRPLISMERTEPMQEFEGFVLRSFVETMLPKDNSFFGGGMAGDMWRSMMAEHIGNEIASVGGIGIADLLRGDEPARARAAADTLAGEGEKGAATSSLGALRF